MEESDLLAKKDLLALTGISYGQLYRWKRQNLIPESWFIKQASFTGQETFFPKEKILKRVGAILKLKDQYSLEELAEIFTPELANKVFPASSVRQVEGLNPNLVELFLEVLEKDNFTFRELLFVYALTEIDRRLHLEEAVRVELAASIKTWLPQLKSSNYQLFICQTKEQKFSLLADEDSTILPDHGSVVLSSLKLNDLASELRSKLTGLEEVE